MFASIQARSRVLAIVLAAFALGVILPGALARGGAEPTAVRSALAQSSSVQGAPDRTMVLSRVVVEPGAKLALHHHLGTQISRVASGTLTYTVRQGSAVVREGDAEKIRGRSAPSPPARLRASGPASGWSSSPPTFTKRPTAAARLSSSTWRRC